MEAHSLEAWTVVWSSPLGDGVDQYLLSGGDDSCLHKIQVHFQKVTNPQESSLTLGSTVFQDSRTHQAGVTAILCLGTAKIVEDEEAELVLTGSYDEYVRLLALQRGAKRPRVLAEARLGGGVWRLKSFPVQSNASKVAPVPHFSLADPKATTAIKVLASCMHAGVRLLKIGHDGKQDWSIDVLAQFTEHDSMNYGSDLRSNFESEGKGMMVVSTSFYDRRLCSWTFPDE